MVAMRGCLLPVSLMPVAEDHLLSLVTLCLLGMTLGVIPVMVAV